MPTALIQQFCRRAEWHHASKFYNEVNFYDRAEVLAVFGVVEHADYKADEEAVAALARHKHERNRKKPEVRVEGVRAVWVDWGGSRRRPKRYPRDEGGCTVVRRGEFVTITTSKGEIVRKSLHNVEVYASDGGRLSLAVCA